MLPKLLRYIEEIEMLNTLNWAEAVLEKMSIYHTIVIRKLLEWHDGLDNLNGCVAALQV